METRASKKDNSGDKSMPSRTRVQNTDNVVGASQILTMMLQMQQEAARDRREDARIAKQTEKIRKEEQSASEKRFLQLLQHMQASNISTQQRAQEIQDKKDTELIERADQARRQALADQEALLRQQALMKQQQLDQLKEQAQLEREERKRADDETPERGVEYRQAKDWALGRDTPRHAKMTNPEVIDVFLLTFEQHTRSHRAVLGDQTDSSARWKEQQNGGPNTNQGSG